MEQTSENKFRSLKKLKIIVSTFLALLVIFSIQITTVFAGDDDLGSGLSGNENTGAVGNGFSHVAGGYRCYMENKAGKIKQKVESIACLTHTKLYLFQITISVQGIVIFYLS